MGVYKLSNSSVKTGRTIYGSMLAGNTAFVPVPDGAMDPLQVITVGPAGASSVSFTNIPSTYTHLQLRGIVRSTTSGTSIGDNVDLRFNSDSGSNYARHLLQGDGSTAATSTNTSGSLTRFTVAPRAGTTASTFTGFVMDILDYANTNKYKTLRTLSGVDTNGAGIVMFISGLWMSTSAVTSITLLPEANNFSEYSQFALYGVKSA